MPSRARTPEVRALLEKAWLQFKKSVKDVGPVDVLVCNGDMIDGRQRKAESGELITHDLDEQVAMASEIVGLVEFDRVLFTSGTPYHVSLEGQNFEKQLAARHGAEVVPQLFLSMEDVTFYFRHAVAHSTIPQGRQTPLSRMRLWNALRSMSGEEPLADVMIYSHVHYHAGAYGRGWEVLTTPALQINSNYGQTQCSGETDWGMIWFEVEKGSYRRRQRIYPSGNKAFLLKV
jgi:hypothetical protein